MANTQHADRSVLSQCTVDLNALAQQGKLDPVVGRTSELQRMIQVLCRRRKNNPLLLGQPGVGKTAIAEGLAQCIVQRKVPDSLAQAKVYLFNMLPMLSGTKYRGDLEKKLKTLLQQLQQEPGAILFVDDIHNLVGAGAASGGGVDLASLIKPMLSSGAIRCIGATHYQAYQGIFEKASGLTRLFQTIDVHEASIETTVHILQGLRSRLEAHHGVRYAANALRAAAELGDRYLRDRCLPDKAIDIVDEAGSCQHARPGAQRKRRVDTADVERVVARMAQVPPHKVSRRDKDKLAHLERNLKMVVFGQDRAIESLASAMVLSRSGLRDVRRPMGCFLLAGPTGVGKTEVGRQLAHALDMELIRFDMSEYMEQHTVSRLIGAPPGYVGFDQGGLLNDAVHRQPHAVLLLDEIEKAHPDVFNLLLQVMDHGTLTDHNGRATDFRHTIVLMTTNAGARDMARASVGFKVQDHSSDGMQAIQSQFPAEFRNRLDDILTFQPLSMETVSMVVDKFLSELEGQLSVKGVVLHVTTEARAWLCTQGYDLTMGARPMARVIQQHIKHPLAKALLFGPLLHGGCVTVEAAGERLALDCKARALVRSRARG